LLNTLPVLLRGDWIFEKHAMKRIIYLLLLISLTACAAVGTPFDWNAAAQVKIGMTDAELIALMGKPYSVTTVGESQIWRWRFIYANGLGQHGSQFVSFGMKDGKVASVPDVTAFVNKSPQTADNEEAPTVYTEFRDLSEAEKQIISQAAAKGLKDPASIRLRWVPRTADSSVTYCAMRNAKNSYGGYAGFQTYIVSVTQTNGKVVSAALDETGRGTLSRTLFCKKQGLDPESAL
jgi:hypothetical protein